MVPPAVLAVDGLMPVRFAGQISVKSVFAALVPAGVVTSTLTGPEGEVSPGKIQAAWVLQVIVVSLTTVKLATVEPPKVTLVAPVKPVPVSVTLMLARARPEFGVTLVRVGRGKSVKTQAAPELEALLLGVLFTPVVLLPSRRAPTTNVPSDTDTEVPKRSFDPVSEAL